MMAVHTAHSLENGSRGWNLIIGGSKFNPLLGQRWLIIWNIPEKKRVIVAQMRGSAPQLIGCFGENLGTQLPEKAALDSWFALAGQDIWSTSLTQSGGKALMSCNKANMFGKTLHFKCFQRREATGVLQDVVFSIHILCFMNVLRCECVQCDLRQLTMIIFWKRILGLLKKRMG